MIYAEIQQIDELRHSEYIMETLTGLGKIDRERIASIIRGTKGTISVTEAAEILGVSPTYAAKMLARWARKGWFSRVKRGLYIPVPLESRTADVPLEDPWLIAERLYSPCYIGGWSAAEHWDLTEQMFRTVVVMTTQKPRDRSPTIKGTSFWLCTVSDKVMFGLKSVWRGKVKISISDPTRTILDMLNDPRLGGGIRSTADMLNNYFRTENKNLELLIQYAERLGNGAVFKRLGFLLERLAPNEVDSIDKCRTNLTTGNAKLDLQLSADRLITRWRLWVPEAWAKESSID
jgi:predicted transcriptional regulator of viral defense system